MELSVFERLILLNILPREGDYRTLRQLRELREELAFSDDEQAALQFRQDEQEPGTMHWLTEADRPKDVPLGDSVMELIGTTLRDLDRRHKLRDEQMGLYERFVLEPGAVREAERIASGQG